MRQFGLLAMAVALLFTFSRSLAAETCEGLFTPEAWTVSDQVQKNRFITDRDLSEYLHQLHPDFVAALRNLRSDQHWVDLGAGKAIAQIDYLKSFDKISEAPLATAVAYKLDRWFRPSSHHGKLEIREGAFEAQDTASWKKADVITDVMGVISYTKDLTTTLQKVFDLLNVHGELYLEFSPAATNIKTSETSHKLLGFLARIDGITVTGQYGIVKIVKLKEKIVVPQLEIMSYKEEYPPYRTFRLVE
ncbi:hypothetical protein D3C87_1095990 [compost metagenome]